jgi:riboflavin biosynthesis pyrimidine reductase
MTMLNQVFPVQKQVPLEGLYLNQGLMDMANELGRSLVLTDYLTDQNGVVAKADKNGKFQVPTEIKNASDWGRFQELMAQAELIISGGSYFKRLERSQDVLYQFEPGNAFETLGQWRLNVGYPKRSPDVAVITRQLDFELPEQLLKSNRKIIIFTTDAMANSEQAKTLKGSNTKVIRSGDEDVDGRKMIDSLNELGYRVIMMASGPHVLNLLLTSKCLDLLYVTEAHVKIPFEDPATVQTILLGGKKVNELKEFQLSHQYDQENVVTDHGSHISQSFLRYDNKELRIQS